MGANTISWEEEVNRDTEQVGNQDLVAKGARGLGRAPEFKGR